MYPLSVYEFLEMFPKTKFRIFCGYGLSDTVCFEEIKTYPWDYEHIEFLLEKTVASADFINEIIYCEE